MNSKTTANSQLSKTEPKKQKQKLSKQLEQEQNHRIGDYTEDYQWGDERGRRGEKAQGIKSIIGRHKIDRERLRIVLEIDKPKNLICTTHGHELSRGRGGGQRRAGRSTECCRMQAAWERREKEEKKIGNTIIA